MDEQLPKFPLEEYFEVTPIQTLKLGTLEVCAALRKIIIEPISNNYKFAAGVAPQARACLVQQSGCL